MAGGSFIAGATSEGGGAVAFPVMTLLLKIDPHVARDFALMIQSVGMTMAACSILMSQTRVQWSAIGYAGLGGAFGIVVSLHWISGIAPPALLKLGFVSLWLSFLVALWLINRDHQRLVRKSLGNISSSQIAMLIGVGFMGGIVSGLTGSGIDIVTFSLLVLWGRLSESIATPTSVVLMAMNAVVGFSYQSASGSISSEAWQYWWACVPIVVWGAPLGALFIKNRSRLLVVRILYVSILAQFVAAIVIVPLSWPRAAFALAVFSAGTFLFYQMSLAGRRRLHSAQPQFRAGLQSM
jgi:uncharacterized protein